MPGSMEKPLDGAGLAVVNQIFNERLSQLGGGGVDWEATPYTNMTYSNSGDAFACIFLSTERMNKMMRFVRGALFLNVKSETYSGSQTINFTLPAGFPALTFNTASDDVPMVTGTGAVKLSITGSGDKIAFVLNQNKATITKGLYVGCVFATIIG